MVFLCGRQSTHSAFFFFFSSRRRHTRWPRDWSSDVCSSDLVAEQAGSLSESAVRNALRAAIETAQDSIEETQKVMAAMGCGTGTDAGGKMAPSVAMALARKVK